MAFKNQQDRSVFSVSTTDDVSTLVCQMALDETSFVQLNFFIKAQDDAGRSMNLWFNGSAKRLAGQDAAIVGNIQQTANNRDPGVLWTAQLTVNGAFLELRVTGENGVNIQWRIAFLMDLVF